MKKTTLLFLAFCILSTLIYAQNTNKNLPFTIKGKLTGKQTKFVCLKFTDGNYNKHLDTCYLKNGLFTFSGFVKEPTVAYLEGEFYSDHVSDPNFIEFFLEPGIINIDIIEDKFKQAKIKGSTTQLENEKLQKATALFDTQTDLLFQSRNKLYSSLDKAKDKQLTEKLSNSIDSVQLLMDQFNQKINKLEYTFITTNPNSYLSPYLLFYKTNILPLDSFKMFYSSLGERVKNSYWGKSIGSFIRIKESTAIGCIAPDFNTLDINDNPLSLSSFKGKNVVLLDFWASWCKPCRALSPHLKVLYQQYHTKGFDIIGISLDSHKEAWLKAIKQDSIDIWHHIPWIKNLIKEHVDISSEDDLSEKYELSPIPIQILIDKKGIIVGRWEGQSDKNNKEIDEKLAQLMKE